MNASVLGLFAMMALFGGVPRDAHKTLTVFNDTKAPVRVEVAGLLNTEIAPGASSALELQDYGVRVFTAQVGSHNFAGRFELGEAEGQFSPPDRVDWCVAVQRVGITLLARQDCLHRLKKR